MVITVLLDLVIHRAKLEIVTGRRKVLMLSIINRLRNYSWDLNLIFQSLIDPFWKKKTFEDSGFSY